MKFLKSAFFIVLNFSFIEICAEPVVTGSDPAWTLYYSFDNILYRSNYTNAIVDHKDTDELTPRGKYKDLNGNTIYPYSIATTISGGAPFNGRAAALDGTRYILMGEKYPLYSLGASDHEILISLWVKFSNSEPNGNDCFIAKNTSTGGNTFLFGIWDSKMYVEINGQYKKDTYVDGTNEIDVYNNAWHHFAVAIKKDSTNPGILKVTLWIDGIKKWNNITINNVLTSNQVATGEIPSIGMDLDGTGLTKTDLLEGYVDEVQIFSAAGNDMDVENLYNGRFGVPSDFDVWTSSIEDYSPLGDLGPDLNTPHDNSDGFLYNAHLVLDAVPVDPPATDPYHYYEYLNAVSTFSSVEHDANVLVNNPPDPGWMRNSSQNNYEVILHSGHGRPRGPLDWNGSGDIVLSPDQFTYSGSTRWVFWQSCSTMKYVAYGNIPCSNPGAVPKCCPDINATDACFDKPFDKNEGLIWFGDRFDSTSGPHAFFGFASIMVFYGSGNNGCDWGDPVNNYDPNYSTGGGSDYCFPNGEDLRDEEYILFNNTFWEDVIKENVPIWEAYKDAVEQREYDQYVGQDPDPISVEATIAYKYDEETGFDGSLEQWNSTYRGGSNSSMTLNMDTVVFKKCVIFNFLTNTCISWRLPIYRED